MFAGTQTVAAHHAYNSRLLGAPLFWLQDTAIYAPWRGLQWGSSLSIHKESAQFGYMLTLIGVGLGLVLGLAARYFVGGSATPARSNIYGDAAFATQKEIKQMGLLGQGRGVFLGKTAKGEYLRHNGPEHYAIIAPTRSGKGAGIVVPTLLTWRDSCIVYDLKEENFQRTAGERSQFSDILYFNPNSRATTRFNPLLEIRRGDFEVRDAQNIANMIIEPDRPGSHDHWIRTGNSLLTAAILHVLYAAPEKEKNLAGVAALLSRPDKTLTQTLEEMLHTKHMKDESGRPTKPHPGVVQAVRDVLNKSGDDRSSVVSTVMGYLALYRDPLLAKATEASDFSVQDLVNGDRPKSLYMVIPAGDIDRLRPVIRLIVNLICRRLTEQAVKGEKRDQEHKHKLLLMLDEFPALGRLEFFESALGFLAGYGLKAMLVAQSLAQLKQVYGERSSILDNTHVRVFFRPETIETAEYISKTLGQTTISYKTRSESGKKGSPWFSSINDSVHYSSRQLLTPREVMELPDDEAFVLVGGGRPIRAKKIRYFDDGSFIPLLTKAHYPGSKQHGRYTSPWAGETCSPESNKQPTFTAKALDEDPFTAPGWSPDAPVYDEPTQGAAPRGPGETRGGGYGSNRSTRKVVLMHPYRRMREEEKQKEKRTFSYTDDAQSELEEELA
jgi:type IV secretion system protein VirD4